MVWLYVPGLEASSEELHPSLKNTEPFVMSRGKPMQWLALSRKWKKDGYMNHLFGLTLEHSTAQSGVEKWMSSLRDSHVNHSAKPETSWESMIPDISGQMSRESLAKYDLQSSSWKTYQMSLTMLERISLEICPKWGIVLHGELFELQMPKHLIEGRDSSQSRSIPTPTVGDCQFITSNRKVMIESLEKGNWRGISLKDYVKIFPTPTATGNQLCPSMIKKRGSFQNLSQEQSGKLNPEWLEWLMGGPIGWTELERVEME